MKPAIFGTVKPACCRAVLFQSQLTILNHTNSLKTSPPSFLLWVAIGRGKSPNAVLSVKRNGLFLSPRSRGCIKSVLYVCSKFLRLFRVCWLYKVNMTFPIIAVWGYASLKMKYLCEARGAGNLEECSPEMDFTESNPLRSRKSPACFYFPYKHRLHFKLTA